MNKTIGAGELRESVDIYANQLPNRADSHGVREPEPLKLATFRARVLSAGPGSESKRGGQIVATAGYIVDIRFTAVVESLTAKHFLIWRGKRLNLSGPPVIWPNRDFASLACAEGGA